MLWAGKRRITRSGSQRRDIVFDRLENWGTVWIWSWNWRRLVDTVVSLYPPDLHLHLARKLKLYMKPKLNVARSSFSFSVFFFCFFFGLLAIDSQFRGAHWFWSTTTGAPFGRSSAPFPFVSSAYITPPKMPPSDIFFPLLLGGQTQILLTAPVGSQGSRSEDRESRIRATEPLMIWHSCE